jgi:hypothetical protein
VRSRLGADREGSRSGTRRRRGGLENLEDSPKLPQGGPWAQLGLNQEVVIDAGAGTGRVAFAVAPSFRHVFDARAGSDVAAAYA